MTKKQAENFCLDIASNLTGEDFTDNLYISIKNKGTKVFTNCKHERIDGWLFFWSKNETYYVKEKELGDFIVIEANMSSAVLEIKE
jgi:hypothetical protein